MAMKRRSFGVAESSPPAKRGRFEDDYVEKANCVLVQVFEWHIWYYAP